MDETKKRRVKKSIPTIEDKDGSGNVLRVNYGGLDVHPLAGEEAVYRGSRKIPLGLNEDGPSEE